jgi:hypothetical protein
MPPIARPIPRHFAEPPHELEPYGRWGDQLARRFLSACAEIDSEEQLRQPAAEAVTWYPARTNSSTTYVPATALNDDGVEFYGYVSFRRPEHGDAGDFIARADYTRETAAQNPDWQVDLNDEVIGTWRGPNEARGDVTLIWGRPLVPGAVAVTAEVDEQTGDQCALVQSDRFTLVALDAIVGFGAYPIYLEVAVWNKRGAELARESLYESEADAEDSESEAAPAS